jgi:hypothetical protein
MADKIAEAMEVRKTNCLKIYEKIIVSEKKLQIVMTRLAPYMWYFKMIYDNYEKVNSEELKKFDIEDLPVIDIKSASEVKGLGFTKFLLIIKAIDCTFEGIAAIVEHAKNEAEICLRKITDGKLSNKELKSIIHELEKVVAEHSVEVTDVLGFSDGYIVLMKKLQSVFPYEYTKYIKEE